MKITVEIPDPPEGYTTPERKPVYRPFTGILILVGDYWTRAEDELVLGGCTYICCREQNRGTNA